MGIKQHKIGVNELVVGMFVSGLDRPWTQTPFPLQGFFIRDLDEIKELKIHCNHVYIDIAKGGAPAKVNLRRYSGSNKASIRGKQSRPVAVKATDAPSIKVRQNVYQVSKPVEKEIASAKQLHRQVGHAINSVVHQIANGRNVSAMRDTKLAASQMVDSVLRSPDAFTWLSRIQQKDQHTYSHAMRSAVWAILFGRHIGLSKTDLDSLALGVLLKDIGKTRLPKPLLDSASLSSLEQEKYQMFVEYGVEILRKIPDVPARVISVVKTHCERIDGSGFPAKLQGNKIPTLGKIAGLVTYYDDTVNKRDAEQPLSPSKAVAKLYEQRGNKFQEDLVVEFIRAIGLYPTGTIVELSTGEVGVVVEQNFERRLKPVVLIVMDACGHSIQPPLLLNMAAEEKAMASGKALRGGGPAELTGIIKDVQPGVYNINVAEVLDAYISQRQAKGLFGKLLPKKFSFV